MRSRNFVAAFLFLFAPMSILSHRIYGNGPNIIYILHGIFGMKDNWHNVAGLLGSEYTVITVDARNHGKSFHHHAMSYPIMATDVAGLMEHLGHTQVTLMGHSMGGKTAMKFAEMFPEKLKNLIVVDIALRQYPPGHLPYFKAFETIDFTQIQSRSEAEQAFYPYAPDMGVRQFLLKNLEPMPGGGYQTKFNLPAIKVFYEESIAKLVLNTHSFTGPVLFAYGANSNYLSDFDIPELTRVFPNSQMVQISNAGHWVHADNPSEFLTVIRHFLAG